MPVIPSFTGFAATPNVAGSFLSASKLAQDAQNQSRQIAVEKSRIEQQGQIAQMELKAKQAQMSQQAQMAQMEMEAKQQQFERDMMRREHELAIENQYKQVQLGMKQRELDQAEKINQIKIQDAAREFQAQQMYQRTLAKNMESGMDAEEAARKAMFEVGPEGGSAFSAAIRSGGDVGAFSPKDIGTIREIPGRKDLSVGITGPNSASFLKATMPGSMGDEPLVPIEGSHGSLGRIGNKVVRIPENPEMKMAAAELKSLVAAKAKDQTDYSYVISKKGSLSEQQQALKKAFEDREERIEELKKKLGQTSFTGAASIPPLQTSSSTNKIGRFTVISEE